MLGRCRKNWHKKIVINVSSGKDALLQQSFYCIGNLKTKITREIKCMHTHSFTHLPICVGAYITDSRPKPRLRVYRAGRVCVHISGGDAPFGEWRTISGHPSTLTALVSWNSACQKRGSALFAICLGPHRLIYGCPLSYADVMSQIVAGESHVILLVTILIQWYFLLLKKWVVWNSTYIE